MGGLLQPEANPTAEQSESILRPILIGIVVVGVVVGVLILLLRADRPKPVAPPAYAAYITFSALRASAAENFAGATVNYLDGTITNTGNQTVTHAVVSVTFKDDMGQIAQHEEWPIHVLKTGGAYDEAVDLSQSPLAPGQSEPFRLTFESISAQWNHAYPDLQVIRLTLK
jgi:hypothetical protein